MKIQTGVPPIGGMVLRVTKKGFQKDWCYMKRIGDESGVVCWGSGGRYKPEDAWVLVCWGDKNEDFWPDEKFLYVTETK